MRRLLSIHEISTYLLKRTFATSVVALLLFGGMGFLPSAASAQTPTGERTFQFTGCEDWMSDADVQRLVPDATDGSTSSAVEYDLPGGDRVVLCDWLAEHNPRWETEFDLVVDWEVRVDALVGFRGASSPDNWADILTLPGLTSNMCEPAELPGTGTPICRQEEGGTIYMYIRISDDQVLWLRFITPTAPSISILEVYPNDAFQLAANQIAAHLLDHMELSSQLGDSTDAGQLSDSLPTTNDLQDGMHQTGEFGFTLDQVAESFSDPSAASSKLTAWGWRSGVGRSFESADKTSFLSVSLHQFHDDAAAGEAARYFAENTADTLGVDWVKLDGFDDAYALVQQGEDSSLTIVYVRDGDTLIRVGASSTGSDTLQVAIAIAQTMLEQ